MYWLKMLEKTGLDINSGLGTANALVFHPRLAQRFGGVNPALLFIGLTECERAVIYQAIMDGRINEQTSKEEMTNKLSELWAEATDKTLTHITGLTKSRQRTAMKKLKTLGLVLEHVRGLPARRFIRVNFFKVVELLK